MLSVASALKPSRGAADLIELFNQREIDYCHWKRNELNADGMVGETDLDLLVDRSSFAATITALLDCGFKQAAVRNGSSTPGVLHFYGFDGSTTNLIHVHLYARILTGESLVKSHMLACESILLNDNTRIGSVRVPPVEAESAVALLRTFLKKGSLIHILLHGRHEGRNKRDGVLFPDDAIVADAAFRSLSNCIRAIAGDLFLACHRALAANWPAARQWLLGLQVRRQMRGCARHSFIGRLTAYARLVLGKLFRLSGRKRKNKVLESGGAVIAFIGGDATGKSTLVNEATCWLGRTFAVQSLHLGKPPHTLITLPIHILLPIARRLFPDQRHQISLVTSRAAYSSNGADDSAGPRSLIYAIRALGLAWDRSRLVRKAHRAAAAGEIVICDRYPSDVCGATDGPRLQVRRGKKSWRTKLINAFARWEQRLYQQNLPPDIALRLHVSIETAKLRNRRRVKVDRHNDQNLEARHQPNRAWSITGTKVAHDVDTEIGLAETILSVKKAIWESL